MALCLTLITGLPSPWLVTPGKQRVMVGLKIAPPPPDKMSKDERLR